MAAIGVWLAILMTESEWLKIDTSNQALNTAGPSDGWEVFT